MSGNRVEGAARKTAGAIKEGAGKMVGDRKLEAEGAAEKVGGVAQNKVGKAQDKIGAAIRK